MGKATHLQMVGARDAGASPPVDFLYETPPVAVEALLEVERFPRTIWDPAAGRGAIVEVLKNHGHLTVASDICDYGYPLKVQDFFEITEPLADAIVANPPYNCATEFVSHACSMVPKCAFLLRLAFLEGVRRKEMFQRHRLARVLVFSKRLPRMHRDSYEGPKSSSTIAFAWMVFKWGHIGKPTVNWI